MSTSSPRLGPRPRLGARRRDRAQLLLALAALAGCDQLWDVYPWQARVPLVDVAARFTLADATWFEAEQTLFVFYRVEAEQGLSELSQIELAFRTDEVEQPFIELTRLPAVHQHLAVRCGARSLCGSYSTPVELEPRDVRLRLRYHRDGVLTLAAELAMHVVSQGAPWDARSALVYAVLDEQNLNVQWRLRHQFPAIRNQRAQRLGLRRAFRVEGVQYGALPDLADVLVSNPYGYGAYDACPPGLAPHDQAEIATSARAVFDRTPLPLAASDLPHVCGEATVSDARGEFTTAAIGRKNPQVRPAFPALQTPVTDNKAVGFFLDLCEDDAKPSHRAMQLQRTLLSEDDVVCIDDHEAPGFSASLATRMSEVIDAERQDGQDMVLVIGLHRPKDVRIAQRVEAALAALLPYENERSSPRLSGAFVFDSYAYTIGASDVARHTLWCPANLDVTDLDLIPDTSMRSCAVQPTMPIRLGRVSLSALPILPTESQYTSFVAEYGEAQTGRMTSLGFRAPKRTPASVNLPVGDFGLATFFNNEAITPAPTDAFSYCADDDTGQVMFRVEGFPQPIPLSLLGAVHAEVGLPRYELGLLWDFPFLLHAKYRSTLATAVEPPAQIDFIVAFGLSSSAEQYMGGQQWQQQTFELGDALAQCTRFCDHPTFSSAGVYEVDDLFVDTYADRCYRPAFPSPGDGGYPEDP